MGNTRSGSQFVFSAEQRSRLLALGLVQEQIQELEQTLPGNAAWLKKPPSRKLVFSELDLAEKAAARALKKLRTLDDETTATGYRAVAAALMSVGATEVSVDATSVVSSAIEALEKLPAVFAAARANAPPGPWRFRSANPKVIDRIDSALLRGFTRHYRPPFPPYEIRISASANSKFRSIVSICYEAIGAGNNDPERAIRAYIKLRAGGRGDARGRGRPRGRQSSSRKKGQ